MAMKALTRKNGSDVPIETNGLLPFSRKRQASGKKGEEGEDVQAFTHNSY